MAVTWKKLAYADNVILKSLLTEQGDIIYASAASTPAALPHGTSSQYLKSGGNAANPSWDTPAGGGPTIVRKTANEIVNNSIVLQNDDHLLLAVGANEVLLFNIYLLAILADATADFNFGFAYPTGCSIFWGPHLLGTTGYYWTIEAATIADALLIETSTQAAGGALSTHGLLFTGIIINGANAGNVNFQWAQKAAVVANNTIKTNSCIIAYKLV